MTTNDALLARALKRANEAVVEQSDSPEARARTVAALQAAIAQRTTVAPAPRARWPLALAAGVSLLIGGGLWSLSRPAPVARVVASGGALTVGQTLADATLVESGEGSLVLALPGSVRLELQPRSGLQLRDQGARVVVQRGEVAAEVVSADQPFLLEAGDTVVAVRAGRVRVLPGAGCDGRAQVEVAQGAALVNATTTVSAGEAWPRCTTTTSLPLPEGERVGERASTPPAAVATLATPAPQQAAVTPALGGPKHTPKHPSTTAPVAAAPAPAPVVTPPAPSLPSAPHDERLAQQNELYLQAVNLHRAGDVSGAVRKLDVILEDERSPLGEAALAHKMKWLSETNRPAARAAARQYLQRFPMGFGRADAETLVLETP